MNLALRVGQPDLIERMQQHLHKGMSIFLVPINKNGHKMTTARLMMKVEIVQVLRQNQ